MTHALNFKLISATQGIVYQYRNCNYYGKHFHKICRNLIVLISPFILYLHASISVKIARIQTRKNKILHKQFLSDPLLFSTVLLR